MTGTKIQTIGSHALTIALLALAAVVFVATVISSPAPSAGEGPEALAVPVPHGTLPSAVGPLPDSHSSIATDGRGYSWQTPPVTLPDPAPRHGYKGDQAHASF